MEIRGVYFCGAVFAAAACGALAQKQFDAKEIERAISEQKIITQTRIVTVTKEITRPDGTVERDTTTTDNSTKKEIEKSIQESIKPLDKAWLVSVGTSFDTEGFQHYKVQVDRQILGPVYLGVYGTTRRELGLSAGINF